MALTKSSLFVAVLIVSATLWATHTAPADAELTAAQGEAAEFAAYQRGLTDGARRVALKRCTARAYITEGMTP